MDSMSRSSLVSSPHEGGIRADYDDDDQSPEESSWTMYFEDFSKNNNTDMNENSCCFSDINYQTSSLVSDAACSAAGRHGVGGSSDKSCNRLSFKKRKNKGAGGLVDDDLEDTASSPANSPKVCNLVNHFDKNLQKQKHALDISQEKGSASRQTDETNDDELGFIGRENDDNELKKRGLCLVPLSMAVHYLG
ncbi:hypothetical protein DITRI_Ditri01bG0173100 [Diplodiscus trichospermus]